MGAAKLKAARIARVEREMIETMTNADRAWFEAHPDRSTYIRPALSAEIEFHHLSLGWPVCPGPGLAWFSVVRQIIPGLRCRQMSYTDPESGAIPGEGYACHVWEDFDRQRGGAMLALEEEVRNELSAGGRTVH